MNKLKLLPLISLLFALQSWGYEGGWNYQNFYEEVDWCKQSIIYPSAQDYIKAGISKKRSEVEMAAEAISMVPVFESIGSEMCYCTFNELAKDIKYTDYQRGEVVKQYMAIPRCQNSLKQAMKSAKDGSMKERLN